MLDTLETWAHRVWVERDPAAIDEMCTSESCWHGLGRQPLVGAEAYKAFHQHLCRLLQETRLEVNHYIEQDGWMAALCTFTGRMSDGRQATAKGAIHARVADGKVLEAYNYFDFLGFFMQLGLLPPDTLDRCMKGEPVGTQG
jgi:ketosteroid isomerase-like protein